jgi:peptidoglycan-associated lipoprotein
MAEWLEHHPGQRVTIEGHTDERGTRAYNRALGQRRAYALRAALLAKGVSDSQIMGVVSFGKDRPAIVHSNEAAWAQNRRAVIVAIGSEQP